MKRDGKEIAKENFDPEKHINAYLPVRVNQQRMSNLLQSLLVGLSLSALPIVKKIPTSYCGDTLPTWLLTASQGTVLGKVVATVHHP